MNATLFGNLTIDRNKVGDREAVKPGGSVFYCGKTLVRLGVSCTVFSPYGRDFPLEKVKDFSLVPSRADREKTLVFRNVYGPEGRIQWVENCGDCESFPIRQWPAETRQDILMVAPILPNISQTEIRQIRSMYPEGLVVLMPQGLYRRIGPDGAVTAQEWTQWREIIPLVDAVIASEKDWPEMHALAAVWSRNGPISVVTRAEKGSRVYVGGDSADFPAYAVGEIEDETGAGDIFAAAFAYEYARKRDAGQAAVFANAAAALTLRFGFDGLQYGYREIRQFMRSNPVR